MDEDFSQANNLADKEPKKLREMVKLFFAEAAKYNVLPLDETLDIGFDTGTPVMEAYDMPFDFTGKLSGVTIELD